MVTATAAIDTKEKAWATVITCNNGEFAVVSPRTNAVIVIRRLFLSDLPAELLHKLVQAWRQYEGSMPKDNEALQAWKLTAKCYCCLTAQDFQAIHKVYIEQQCFYGEPYITPHQ